MALIQQTRIEFMLKIKTKKFDELSTIELYEILQLRSDVFVVEQECAYQDVDGKDQNALHIIGEKQDRIVAYARCFPPGYYFDKASIGRVVVSKKERKYQFGKKIMQASIKAIQKHYNDAEILLSAQTYLIKFYNALGFIEEGETYLEDDIPHVKMRRT